MGRIIAVLQMTVCVVLLVAAGLYGPLAYRVSRRTAEIGIRLAMGARGGQVVRMILKDSLVLTAIGVAAAVPSAMLVGRALASSLYRVTSLDGANYALAVAGVACVALTASAPIVPQMWSRRRHCARSSDPAFGRQVNRPNHSLRGICALNQE
jgi:ABC-type antimicrobial peptide transport system permease subunit